VVIVTTDHQRASPPVVMFASGDAPSNWSTSVLELAQTIMARDRDERGVGPRFCRMSAM
jgi:hypothetical protein